MPRLHTLGRVSLVLIALVLACGDAQQCEGDACEEGSNYTEAGTETGDTPACGNGMLDPGEECDDVNVSNTDECLDTCQLASCGDGYVYAGVEDCDDGNTVSGDGCSDTCVHEVVCGDGLAEGDEQCDDGNGADDDACTSACMNAVCGDGIVWTDMEGCDDGNDSDADACTSSCEPAMCGDGYVQDGVEGCDDGNLEDGDGCQSDCTLPVLPMAGDACDVSFLFQRVPELDGNAGTPLLCQNGVLVETNQFAGACQGLCPMGSNGTVNACAGWGEYANCLCAPTMFEACDGAELGCQPGGLIKLCYGDQVVIGECNGCAMMDGYYTCQQ